MADEKDPLLVIDLKDARANAIATVGDDKSHQTAGILQAVKQRVWVVVTYIFIAFLASILIGMLLGYSSITGLELDDVYQSDRTHGIKDKSPQASLFGGFGALGALLGGPIAWPLSDRLGRKPALMLGGIPTLIGWLMIAYAHFADSRSGFLALIYLGRIFAGIGAGWFIFCVSVHVIESSAANLRGRFGACNQLFIVLGILITYVLGIFALTYDNFQYYHVALIAAGIVAVFEFLMLFTMETPPWLLAHGKNVEAKRVLSILRGPSANISKEIQSIQRSIKNTKGLSLTELLQAIRQRSVYFPFILVLMMMFYQQFGGINVATFYSGSILQQASLGSARHAAIIASILVGVVQIVVLIISVFLIDRFGRKILLVMASIGMCIGSLLLGAHFHILNDVCHGCFGINCTNSTINDFAPCDSKDTGWLAIMSVGIFVATYALAWGSIPWLAMPELMPLRVRGVTNSIATLVNWAFAAVITFFFQSYADAVTPKFAWWSFTLVMFTSIFFVIVFLPETKGHSLEEIEEHIKQGDIFAFTCRRMSRRSTMQSTVPVSA